jgi:hypothetical protein
LGACEILRYFASHGNLAAAKRLEDVHQMCESVGIPLDRPVGGQSGTSPVNTMMPDGGTANGGARDDINHGYEQVSESTSQELGSDIMWQMPWESPFPQELLPEELNLEDFSSNDYMPGNVTGMEMTGVIDADWDMLLQASLCGSLWEQLCQTA